jgi:hypothetical protein
MRCFFLQGTFMLIYTELPFAHTWPFDPHIGKHAEHVLSTLLSPSCVTRTFEALPPPLFIYALEPVYFSKAEFLVFFAAFYQKIPRLCNYSLF